ncbi:hypothetical protein ADUPG1_012859 [Aduncisulcus paluster]|uniref:Uncharacterized protein n=1 Tax=Aduncisulcus paluster TaxID=2918883 RepID=A0ABQ5K0X4_9EUKA|nr:hypothetical protein ADUPG1_012859 [Aduncisulcus paluster]
MGANESTVPHGSVKYTDSDLAGVVTESSEEAQMFHSTYLEQIKKLPPAQKMVGYIPKSSVKSTLSYVRIPGAPPPPKMQQTVSALSSRTLTLPSSLPSSQTENQYVLVSAIERMPSMHLTTLLDSSRIILAKLLAQHGIVRKQKLILQNSMSLRKNLGELNVLSKRNLYRLIGSGVGDRNRYVEKFFKSCDKIEVYNSAILSAREDFGKGRVHLPHSSPSSEKKGNSVHDVVESESEPPSSQQHSSMEDPYHSVDIKEDIEGHLNPNNTVASVMGKKVHNSMETIVSELYKSRDLLLKTVGSIVWICNCAPSLYKGEKIPKIIVEETRRFRLSVIQREKELKEKADQTK